MIKILQKIEKIKFYQKVGKIRVIKILRTIPLTLETMQQLIIKPRRRSLVPEKSKIQKNFKSYRIMSYGQSKFFSNI